MKKTALILSVILMPTGVFAHGTLVRNQPKSIAIPTDLMTSGQTSTVQWGCPVAEVVEARNQEEAMQILSQACMDEAKRAVSKKPGVFDVIKVSVVWPDINVSQKKEGYLLKGTFFLETLVLKSMAGE